MNTIFPDKEATINRIETIIHHQGGEFSKWKIGLASIQRMSLIPVSQEIHYFKNDALEANEILYNFIGKGVQVCKLSKIHSEGIYLYR